jgi:hypothetical protein
VGGDYCVRPLRGSGDDTLILYGGGGGITDAGNDPKVAYEQDGCRKTARKRRAVLLRLQRSAQETSDSGVFLLIW